MARFYMGVSVNEGINVSGDEAFEYAKEHLDEMSDEDKADFVEWFFSGNWIKQEGEFNCKGKWKPKMAYPWI
jgi:hypothetical protein